MARETAFNVIWGKNEPPKMKPGSLIRLKYFLESEICAGTCRKGYEGFPAGEIALLVKEVIWIELLGGLPFFGVVQGRSKVWENHGALKNKTKQKSQTIRFCSSTYFEPSAIFLILYDWERVGG